VLGRAAASSGGRTTASPNIQLHCRYVAALKKKCAQWTVWT
jgi:hypothetical protein